MKRTVDDFIQFFEKDFAKIEHQSSWDFSGRQIYLGNRPVKKVCLALDPSLNVVMQAVEEECELLITHHPLFFKPQKGLNINNFNDRTVIEAVKNNLTILSYHTNLDMAPYGVNSLLLDILGATNSGLLQEEGFDASAMLVFYVPSTHAEKVLDAAFKAGAGKIGNYSQCSFSSIGTGSFIPSSCAEPFIGKAGKRTEVEEIRYEIVVTRKNADKIAEALRSAHPYEEPVIYTSLINGHDKPYGFGNIGVLPHPLDFESFIQLIKSKFNLTTLRTNMIYNSTVTRFAVLGGSGASSWRDCVARGVDILITGDVKHHDALDAKQAGVCLIDIGHYHCERMYMQFLAGYLKDCFNDIFVLLAEEEPSILDW